MKFKTLHIYGNYYRNGKYINRIFTSLKQFERAVGNGTGTVKAMSFRHGDCVEYRYAYHGGRRRSFNKLFREEDYYAWNNWYSVHLDN